MKNIHVESSTKIISKKITDFCKNCPENKEKEFLPSCSFLNELLIDLMIGKVTEKEVFEKHCQYYVEQILNEWNK